jgi:hypothetical protein
MTPAAEKIRVARQLIIVLIVSAICTLAAAYIATITATPV